MVVVDRAYSTRLLEECVDGNGHKQEDSAMRGQSFTIARHSQTRRELRDHLMLDPFSR